MALRELLPLPLGEGWGEGRTRIQPWIATNEPGLQLWRNGLGVVVQRTQNRLATLVGSF